MCGFCDNQLILQDSLRFGFHIPGVAGIGNRLMAVGDTDKIRFGSPQCSIIGSNTLEGMTGFQQIKLRFGMPFQQLGQRVTEALPEIALYKCAATLSAQQKAFRFKLLNCFAQ